MRGCRFRKGDIPQLIKFKHVSIDEDGSDVHSRGEKGRLDERTQSGLFVRLAANRNRYRSTWNEKADPTPST